MNSTGTGIGVGSVVAVAMSWAENHSVMWALLHGMCSWFYVAYSWLA